MSAAPRAAIAGTGIYVPEKVLSNADLEKMVETSNDWIVSRTGIHERRVAMNGQATSDLAFIAAKDACRDAGVEPDQLDLIIVATITPDMSFPSTACLVQDRLGARRAGAYDLSAACSGFVYALAQANALIACGQCRNILIIGAEALSKVTDYTDRGSCILFGDGAGAAVLQPTTEDKGVLFCRLLADGAGGDMMKLPAGGSRMPASPETVRDGLHYMEIHGREVYRFAVTTMRDLIQEAMAKCGLSVADVAMVIPHQVNMRILESATSKLGFPMEKVYTNIDRYGNTSAASVPLALHEARAEGRLKAGDTAIMVAFGGGLTWASAVVKF